MNNLVEVKSENDIFENYKNTPIEKLLKYHNLEGKFDDYDSAELLIGMCMDHRKKLNIPQNFAYIIRDGGANLRNSEFKISFAVGVAGIKHIALIGHSDCGMVNLASKKENFINGLVKNAGWNESSAIDHFNSLAPMFEIGNAIDFTFNEAKRLQIKYPKLTVAPMYYKVEDNKLYLIDENNNN